jgi:hypothetical protein
VIDALREHDHVALPAGDADPFVLRVPHIKVACTGGVASVPIRRGQGSIH